MLFNQIMEPYQGLLTKVDQHCHSTKLCSSQFLSEVACKTARPAETSTCSSTGGGATDGSVGAAALLTAALPWKRPTIYACRMYLN